MKMKTLSLFLVWALASLALASASVESTDQDRLFSAVKDGEVEEALKLLKEKRVDVNAVDMDSHNHTLLHFAAGYGYIDIVNELLEQKAEIDATNSSNYTPLHCAVAKNRLKVFKALLDAGANANIPPPLDDFEIIQDVDALGANMNSKNPNNETLLHYAARHKSQAIVRELLVSGAERSVVDFMGRTPLHLGARAGSSGVVKVLLEYEFDVNARDRNDETPLHLAIDSCHVKTIKELLENGADVNAKNKSGQTPLHYAARQTAEHMILYWSYGIDANSSIVNLLLEHGADVNAQDTDGVTPLHDAAEFGHFSIAETLFSRKDANLHAIDRCGRTPLELCSQKGWAQKIFDASKV